MKRNIIIIILLSVLIILTLTECTSIPFETKYVEITCPKYPEYKHFVRVEEVKNLNPDKCPKEKQK